jgi:hypothetical protein
MTDNFAVESVTYTGSMRAHVAFGLFSLCCAFGQTTPKDKVADYPAHAMDGTTGVAAEYLVHSVPAGTQTFIASDYLVMEVAVFPALGEPIEIGTGTFKLRLNGKKEVISSEGPGFVAASVKYPDWEQRKNVEVQGGIGDAGVVVGRPPAAGRFPGDPTPQQSRLPRAPKAPAPDDRNGIEKEEPARAEEVIAQRALPEGPAEKPVSGYIYFRYRGKTKSIKSLELIYNGKSGPVTLKLL